MKILIYLHHPAQYHLFKNSIKQLEQHGHTCIVFATKKDILTNLLDSEGFSYINNLPYGRKNNKLSMAMGVLKQDWGLFLYCIKNRPDIFIGTSAEICHVGTLLHIPAFFFSEDDAEIIPLGAKISYPFAKGIISPFVCSAGRWEHKKIGYQGYQKLAYLHPSRFTPDINMIKNEIDTTKPYFLLRFAELTAYHDKGKNGFNTGIIKELLDILRKNGNVYINSEGDLDKQFVAYQLNLDIRHIHHALYYSSIYIGDSQSMAVEAALLGVPGIRFNDFAGKISVLKELENKYNLTYGIPTSQPDMLLTKVRELLQFQNLKEIWKKRRQKMLSEKIDVTAFIVWFVEQYPESVKIMKENPDYQYRFK
jgi:predicted glycosyltransferase